MFISYPSLVRVGDFCYLGPKLVFFRKKLDFFSEIVLFL